jgi:hypothetical protein
MLDPATFTTLRQFRAGVYQRFEPLQRWPGSSFGRTSPGESLRASQDARRPLLYLSLISLPLSVTHAKFPRRRRGESMLCSEETMRALRDRFGETRAG